MTAALATPNARPFGADTIFGYINDKQLAWLSVTPDLPCCGRLPSPVAPT
jgi:hypothetical protein